MSGKTNWQNMKKSFQGISKIALDSNIFIYYFGGDPIFGPKTKAVFNLLKKKKGVTSIITLTELLAFKTDQKTLSEIEEAFFNTPNLNIADIDKAIAKNAARIRHKYGFRLADSFQLATAVAFKADIFVTNDKRLKSFPEVRIQLLSEIS